MESIKIKAKWKRIFNISPFTSQVFVTILTNIVLAGISLLTGILLARMLRPVGRGELAAIQTWPMFLASVAMIGLPEALVYYSAREPNYAGQYLSSAILLALIACIPFGILSFFLIPYLLAAQNSETIASARIYLSVLPIFALQGMFAHPLRGRKDVFAWNTIRLLPSLAWIVILLINLLLKGFSAHSLAKQYLVALGLLSIPMGMIVFFRIPGSFRPGKVFFRPLLAYGLPTFLSSLPGIIHIRLDQFLIMAFLGPHLLGLYVVAFGWSNAPMIIISALGALIVPHIAEQSEKDIQTTRIAQSLRIGSLLSVGLTMIITILTPFAIPLFFGSQFKDSIYVAVILCLAGGFAGLNQLLESSALGLGKPRYVLLAESLGLIVTIVLLILLLKPLLLIGAAIASLTSYITISLILVFLIGKDIGLRIHQLLIPHGRDISLLSQTGKNIWKEFTSER